MKKLIISSINIYQKTLSPDHGTLRRENGFCRFYPSCSQYTKLAVQTHGSWRGLVKGAYRVVRCNPYSSGGIDESYTDKKILLNNKKKAVHV